MKASYEAAVAQMDELLAQLKHEKQKNVELVDRLQLSSVAGVRAQQVKKQRLNVHVLWWMNVHDCDSCE